MKGYTLLSIVLVASQQLAQVNFAYAKLESGSSIRRLLPEESIVDHVINESSSNTHFIIAAENEHGAAHPDIRVRLSEDAVTEDTLISYDDDTSSRRRGPSSRRILVSAEADTFTAISIHTTDGIVRGIVQKKGEASKNIVQEKGQRTLVSESEELEMPQWKCTLEHDGDSDEHSRHLEEEHMHEEEHDHDHHSDHHHHHHHHHHEFESTESAIESIRQSLRGTNHPNNRKLLFGQQFNYVVEVYLDIDQDFVDKQGNGNEQEALDYLNLLWSSVNAMYEEEVGLRFFIKHVRITSEWETDASGAPYLPDWANRKITEIEDRMLAKYSSNGNLFWQEHDLYHAHLSRYQWGGHAKGVGTFCQQVSASITTDFRSDLYGLGYLGFDLYIIAHEVGHNAGSHHTHETYQYQPVVDSCGLSYTQGGFCKKLQDGSGTIMSWCHLCQDTRKIYPTIGGTYSETGDILDPNNWNNNANLRGKTNEDPQRVPLEMYKYVSSLHATTNCLAIPDGSVTTTSTTTAATTTAEATTTTQAITTTIAATTTTNQPPSNSCGDSICQPAQGEDCLSCPGDCAGVTNGKPQQRYCCGDGIEGTVSCAEDSRCTSSGWQCDLFGELV